MFYDSYRLNASYLPYTKCEMGKTKSLEYELYLSST